MSWAESQWNSKGLAKNLRHIPSQTLVSLKNRRCTNSSTWQMKIQVKDKMYGNHILNKKLIPDNESIDQILNKLEWIKAFTSFLEGQWLIFIYRGSWTSFPFIEYCRPHQSLISSSLKCFVSRRCWKDNKIIEWNRLKFPIYIN